MSKQFGIVKWFSDSLNYGFITSDSGEDVFVHFTGIVAEGHKNLTKGDRVEFDVEIGRKGLPQAIQVLIVKKAGL